MKNFIFNNTTKIVFGRGQIAKLSSLIPTSSRLMVTFGGGSARRNGIYDQVVAALSGVDFVEFWGIEPNPSVQTLREAIKLGKSNDVDYVLAVGGGSVVDGTKLIAAGLANDIDAWEIVLNGYSKSQIPFASVMTMPATGSEMNRGSVITNKETNEKLAWMGNYPQFTILDPETTFSIPYQQIANGLADIFTHVMEQYLTTKGQSRIMDRWSEGIMLTILEIAPKIKKDSRDYDLMSEYMLSATMALNDFIRMGVTEDWTTHMIGHELTAFHGITHGHSLALLMHGTMRVLKEQKWDKILQLGSRVFGISDKNESEAVEKTIKAVEDFYRSLGLTTRLGEEKISATDIDRIVMRLKQRDVAFGENKNVTADVVEKILNACL